MVNAIKQKSVLLLSMPFADTTIPSIQLSILESYLKKRRISTTSIHLYLFAANIYGLPFYSFLINPPNDPYSSQMIYAKYVFQDHWKNNEKHFEEYYNTSIVSDQETKETYPFEVYIEKTDEFLFWVTDNIPWEEYDIIGFSLNYGQFLPSLAVTQYIKKNFPDKTIVFGGTTTMSELGQRILNTFDCIDYIITGDGEESLYLLSTISNDQYKNIPGLILRLEGKSTICQENNGIDLNDLPMLDFNSFYQNIGMVSTEIQQYFQLNGRLPIEISRGCWWNKCSFCNQRAYHPCYREKKIDRFIQELDFLSDFHKHLSFQIVGSTLPQNNIEKLCKEIIALGKDFSFIAETRADQLKDIDYLLLHQAGFKTIQTGIETFSRNYLKKMNKGTRIIDNIAALKFCREYGIKNEYNLIINFPNEEFIDFQQTIDTISLFKQYLDPPRISPFVVGYKSLIYDNLEKYNIKSLKKKRTDKIMFPEHILQQNIQFFYDYNQLNTTEKYNWKGLVENWKQEREHLKIQSIKSNKTVDELIFYYIDGVNFIKIYDKRNLNNINIFILNEIERKIFLDCKNIITYDQLKLNHQTVDEQKMKSILDDLIEPGIIYQEDDCFLSLPLCNQMRKTFSDIKSEKENLPEICLMN